MDQLVKGRSVLAIGVGDLRLGGFLKTLAKLAPAGDW
jgi:hypothetical protein